MGTEAAEPDYQGWLDMERCSGFVLLFCLFLVEEEVLEGFGGGSVRHDQIPI